jgi:arylsulfate sulfotransferase
VTAEGRWGHVILPTSQVSESTMPFTALIAALAACTGPNGGEPVDPPAPPTQAEVTLAYVHDPTGYAPLGGELTVTASVPVTVEVRIPGDDGPATEVVHETQGAEAHVVPVLGLYPDRTQDVEVVVRTMDGVVAHEETLSVTTPRLSPAVHSNIDIIVADVDRMTPGFTLVSAFGQRQGPQRPMMFDPAGAVRWTLDFTEHPRLGGMFYDVGVERLANGNLYFGDGSTASIYEVDMLGRVVDTWPLDPYDFHHHVQELENGNFLVTASLRGADTVEDQILEIDRDTKEIVTRWDLRESLDPDRWTWSDQGYDWVHVNAVQYDASDDTLVISGRTQGVVKLTRDNEVVWILAPHVDWATAGDGTDLSTKLLQPLDASGEPIDDPAVAEGRRNHPDFQWNWTQHAVEVLGEGEIAIFDNGVNRNFDGSRWYSRAVRYRIDATERTVQQLWSFGESRGEELFSMYVSDVDVLDNGHLIMSPGASWSYDSERYGPYGAIVELDPDDQVVFEAKIWPANLSTGITFHRTERMTLYP